MEDNGKYKILFVCLGNICRSPAAEGVMKKMSADAGLDFEIASCGLISYHTGETPDDRMLETAERRGYPLNHRARKILGKDFAYYDMIIGMDRNNITELKELCPKEHQHKIHIMSEYFQNVKGYTTVPDPYYGDMRDFDNVITLLEDACGGLIEKIRS